MALRPAETHRLAFIKFIMRLGQEHAQNSEPNCAVSLLHLHDGIELLLQLAAEKLDAKVDRKTTFLVYWDVLASALATDLPFYGAMKRLNEARVALKHHGHLPRRPEIADFAETAIEFAHYLTPLVFGLSWEAVSQADFVRSERARALLKAAESAFERNDFLECLIECRKTYETLMTEYSPFEMRDPMLGLEKRLGHKLESPLRDIVEWFTMALMALRHDLETLATGVDPRRVSHFLELTPIVEHSANFRWHVVSGTGHPKPTAEHATFCVEFVLDTALKLESNPFHNLTDDERSLFMKQQDSLNERLFSRE